MPCHAVVPSGSAWDGKGHVLLALHHFFVAEEDIDHGDRVFGVVGASLDDLGIRENDLVSTLSLKVFG